MLNYLIRRGLGIIGLFLWSLIFSTCFANLPERELTWRNIGCEEPMTSVYCIFGDSNGEMWIGTNNGLYFFDGVKTHKIGEKELGDYHIYALQEYDGKIFIGTNNGLFIFNYTTGKLQQFEGVMTEEIRALLVNGDELWIGSLKGIFTLDLNQGGVKDNSKGLPSKSVYSILKDSRGILYVGTYNGLARWDSIDKNFNSLLIDNITPIGNHFVNCLLEADDMRSLYVGGENFLYKYTPSTDKWEKSPFVEGFNVKSLTKSKSGHIIIGTDDGLIDFYNDTIHHYRHDSRQPNSISHNEIWSVYCDLNDDIWAGHERGFSIASNSEIIKKYPLGSLTQMGEGNEINKILRDSRGNLWLGGSNGLIYLPYHNDNKWFRHSKEENSLSHNRIRDILETNRGKILLATDGGLNLFDDVNGFKNYHVKDKTGQFDANWSYSLTQKNDEIIIGSYLGGLLGIKETQLLTDNPNYLIAERALNTTTDPGLPNNYVNQLVKDKTGNVWVLLFRDNALMKFDSEMGNGVEYNIFEITGEYPSHIALDSYGDVWCAFKGGAIKFKESGDYSIVKLDDAAGNENVLDMKKVKDDIWISTHSNLWKINSQTLSASLLPIPSHDYTAIYEDPLSGNVFLGGQDEIVEIEYAKIKNITQGGIKIWVSAEEGMRLLEWEKEKLKLPHRSSINLVISNQAHNTSGIIPSYSYKLASNENDSIGSWVELPRGMNTITLSNIKMGNYKLLIRAEGTPVSSISIPLEVEAPPALSWWAIVLYSLAFCLIIFCIIYFLNKKRRRDLEMQQRETELTNVEKKLSFLSTISHDLKTPLSMILGPVSLMKDKTRDKDMQKQLNIVYENAVRLNSMIHKTIELQHIENAEEGLLILSRFDVVELCKAIFEVFQENHPTRKFVFTTSCDSLLIEADAIKLESIVNNLLSNACKYSEEGCTISLGIRESKENVEIIVADDGIGIAEEDKSLVFHKMFRSPEVSSDREGTGLGLYLIKKYLELMGGCVTLTSHKGEGSTFTIFLPLIRQEEKIEKVEPVENGSTEKPKVLIVEDNLQISSFIQEFLKNDYNVLTAENGRSGVALASTFLPDLIIVDEMMPVMSGLEMTKRIKENPKLSHTPIIMLTAKNDNQTETESIKRGIDTFMSKPFEPAVLLIRIQQLLKGRKEIVDKLRIETIIENENKPIEAESVNERNIASVIKLIEENISDPDFNVEMLSKKSGLSSKNLYRLIKKYTNTAPLEFIRQIRLQKAAALLSQKRFTVSEICYMTGFKTPSYFTKCFQKYYGKTPTEFLN